MNTLRVLVVCLSTGLVSSPDLDCIGAPTWEQALEASLEHSPDSKEVLERIVRSPDYDNKPVQGLAVVLLEEWSLDPAAPSFSRPRLVFVTDLDGKAAFEDLSDQASLNLVVLAVEVAAEGSVEEVEILRRTPHERHNELVEQAFRHALFRPAREGEKYVTSTTRLHVTWPPRL